MAKLLKLRRGTTTQHGSFTGAEGEVTIDTTKDTAVVHDGAQAGGRPLAREDMSNVSSASIAGQLGTDSIAVGKIAAGTLPSDVKVTDSNVSGNLTIESADIVDGTIVNADINASANIANSKLADSGVSAGSVGSSTAIPIITVNSKGIVTGTSTTAIDSTTIANGSASVAVSSNGPITSNANHDFSAGIDVTGVITSTGNVNTSGNINITNETPKISFIDSGNNPDFSIENNNGQLRLLDTTNNVGRIVIQSDGTVDVAGNLDANGGLDVTGEITGTGGINVATNIDTSGALRGYSSNTGKWVRMYGSSGTGRWDIYGNGANLRISDNDQAGSFVVDRNTDLNGGLDVTGNITVTGTVDGRDVASDGSKLDGIESGATADQSAAEIAAALNGQHVRTTAQIGRDSNDHFQFTDNNRLDLYINGNNEFRFESDGDFHADGDVYAYSTTTASDENLKENIVTVTDAVAKVEALKGVTFKWKKNELVSAGVIAQDVEKVLPEVVKTVGDADGNEYKAVNYGGLTSILIEAIKDLSARIKVLEAK